MNNNELDTAILGLEAEPTEHDQLVHAAIMGAGELAKQLSLPPTSSNLHHSHNHHHSRPDGAAINQLAHAASALSAKGRARSSLKQRLPSRNKIIQQNDNSLKNQELQSKYDAASMDSLIEQCATDAYNWFHSQNSLPLSGPRAFSREEIAIVDNYIAGYCRLNNMTRLDVCRRVWSTEKLKDGFWEAVAKVLPYRSRASIYKHVRRQYHIFDIRAKWTKEEDEILSRLTQSTEMNWKKIGEAMNRMPEDCRDRWRNYVKCGDNRALNKWSEEEERTLKNIVLEMITSESDGPINWTLVSERMNGVRSRIQCRYKWNKLLRRESISRVELMDNETKVWLINRLIEGNFPNVESIDWDYILHLYHEWNKDSKSKDFLWTTTDFKVGFERLRSIVKDHKNQSLHTVLSKIASSLYSETGSDRGELVPHESLIKVEKEHSAERQADSIATAAVAAVSTGVNEHDAQPQEYSLWRE